MLLELSRPFSYLTISHPSRLPSFINWWIPVALSATCILIGHELKNPVDFFGSSGFLSKFLGFVQNLPGFYLAALAAISTFQSNDLDKLMPGTPPTSKIVYNGSLTTVELTRRRMLCILFSYLTVESFALTIGAISATTLADPLRSAICSEYIGIVKAVGAFAYLIFVWQLLTVTLWGIYYLGERIHTPDR